MAAITVGGREAIEHALDNGQLWARMRNGNHWQCRRNGRTQTWKTRPDHFRIPVKAGFSATDEVTHFSSIANGFNCYADFVISAEAPAKR